MYTNRNFVIFNTSELNKIDFTQVLETSADTVRKSVDGTLTFVKWEGVVPACINSLTTKGLYLTYDEMLIELQSSVWTNPNGAM